MNSIGKNLKTMASVVELPMVDEVLTFHNKANINLDSRFKNQVSPHALSLNQLQYLERSDYEITPFHDQDIRCEQDTLSHRRKRSAQQFNNEKIAFSTISNLLNHVFAFRAGARAYPSGGALYPVEIICVLFEERLHENFKSGFYHYRPHAKVLQCLRFMESDELRSLLFQQELTATQNPNFALIHLGVLEKMLVKYRYRGYRYALIETGCMCQQADLTANELGLVNKLYSGFNDHEIVKAMGLDPLNFLPLVIQSFGRSI